MTSDTSVVPLRQPDAIEDPLTVILRSGARRLLAQAVEAEADAFLALMKGVQLPDGRERLVRHGLGPERVIQTGIGPVAVRRVKLRDRDAGNEGGPIRFTSAILPRWARRTRSLDALLPILYLRGISMGDFQTALAALLGADAPNLSPSVIARLRGEWEADYARWQRRDLSARRYVYVWADGVYLQARMEPQAECMLVLIGATPEGRKASGVADGHAGKRSELEGTACRSERAGSVDRAGHCGRRRRARLLEGPGGSVSLDPPPAVLAAQESERSRQAAEVGSAQRPSGFARNLVVREPRGRRSRDDDLRREICAQIRQGGRLPAQGSRCAVTLPVETFDKRRQLRRRQTHHAVLDLRPLEPVVLKSFRKQAHARAVPVNQLHPVGSFGPEHVDRAVERIGAHHVANQRRQTFCPFAEVDRTRRDQHAHRPGRTDHFAAFNAPMIAVTIAASASRQIQTLDPAISNSMTGERASAGLLSTLSAGNDTALRVSTTTGANGRTPVPSSASRRAWRRQLNNCCGVRPW